MRDDSRLASRDGVAGPRWAVEQLPALLWATDSQVRFTALAGAGWAALEIDPEQLVGEALDGCFRDGAAEPSALDAHRRALRGERVGYDQRLADHDYRVTVAPLRDERGRVLGCAGAAVEITSRKRAERTLREEHERLQTLASRLPGFLYQMRGGESVFDIPYLGPQIAEFTGLSAEEIQANPLLMLESIHPDDRPLYYERAIEAIKSQSPFQADFRVPGPGGQIRWVRAGSRPTALEDGRLVFHGVAIDITDLKESELALRKGKEELGRFGHDRARELFAANERLTGEIVQRERAEESLLAEREFLRRMLDLQERERKLLAYDIHDGFVQDVIGAQMILEGALARTADEAVGAELEAARRHLGKAVAEGRRLIAELRPMIIDEQGVVAAIESLLEDARRKSGIQFSFAHQVRFERLAPMLEGTIYRVAQEAVANIRRHSQTRRAEIRMIQIDERLRIEIEDFGVGFDPSRVPRDRFGLEGIRERARLFGGRAEIASAPGQATTVTVELPLDGRL
jgi:PAS domain S-box-containing protein